MTAFFGAIADDFTGATDLASLLARSGARVTLRLGLPAQPPDDTEPIEIVALKCRTAPVAEAVSEAGRRPAMVEGSRRQKVLSGNIARRSTRPRVAISARSPRR
jgi:hypothetical protein